MEEDEETPQSSINFIPCLYFVKKAVAKENPDKVTLTQEELARVINETRNELSNLNDNDDDNENDSDMETSDNEQPNQTETSVTGNNDDEFNFNNYDNEVNLQFANLADVAIIDPNDQLQEDEDSEAEDDIIKKSDNLVVVGHVDEDSASLEVFVYNEEEGSFYVHHDFLLPSYPLCIEWMHYDPESREEGNMVAIGSMDPIITIWDLDIQDTLEPALKLGSKGNRKKNIAKFGHTDAVLDLSWNVNFSHILASGSVDQSIILWDLDELKPHTIIKGFQDKVQTLKFHPTESQSLLAGGCDGTVRLFDCRDPDVIQQNAKIWNFNGEIERITWDAHDSNYFFASTNHGSIYYCDVRKDRYVWTQNAHEKEVTGLAVNSKCVGMLTTTSADGILKVWQYSKSDSRLIHEEDVNIGQVQCIGVCPDNPFTVVVGGDRKRKNLQIINVQEYDSVRRTFETSV